MTKKRYKTEGYIRSEERKKLTRRINNLKKDITSGRIKGAANISSAEKLIGSLEKAKEESYYNRKEKRYKIPRQRLLNAVMFASQERENIFIDDSKYKPRKQEDLIKWREYGEEQDTMTLYRKNTIFQGKLNLASRASDEMFSDISKAEVKIFYKMTQDFWQGEDSKTRNQAIIEKMYAEGLIQTKSLEEAFDIVMMTDVAQEALKMAETELDIETETSPDYIDYVAAYA